MKLQDLFEYLKENLFTTLSDVLQVNHFILDKHEPLLVQLPYSRDFVFRFYYYLQLRIFISYSHLVPLKDLNVIFEDAGTWEEAAVDLPAKNLRQILTDSIHYKDNTLFLGIKYLANDGRAAWNFSIHDNVVTISDWINGWDDGSVLENFWANYDEIMPWQKNILDHFGGYMDNNHICLDFEVSCQEDFIRGVIKYLHMTVLISSGHRYID